MKTQQEIEQLANEYSDIGKEAGFTRKEYTLENIAYKKGYAQCQQDIEFENERMYSEEEKELMIKIFHSYWVENNHEHEDNLKEWELSKKLFEQFKKK